MELQQLRYFKAVADAGKISDAAKSLYISPPALSATISRLEHELGVKLFDRTNNRVILNKQGELLLGYVNQILGILNNMSVELRRSQQQEKEHIQVAVTFSNLWVGLICAFSLEHPNITLSYTTLKLSQLLSASERSRYHFILAEKNDIPAGLDLDSVPLIPDDSPVLMLNSRHALAGSESVEMEQLRSERWVLPVFDQSLHRMTCELLDGAQIAHTSAMECSYMVRRSIVMNNSGVSVSTRYSSQYEEPSFRYIPIHSEASWEHRLFWRQGQLLTPQESLFRDFAVDFFAKNAIE